MLEFFSRPTTGQGAPTGNPGTNPTPSNDLLNRSTMFHKLIKPGEVSPPGCPDACTLRRLTRCGLVASGATSIVGLTTIVLASTMNLPEGANIAGYMGGGLLIISGLTGLSNLLFLELFFNNHEETMKLFYSRDGV